MSPDQLKSLQRGLGLSESSFSAYLGISVSGLRKWLAGTRAPTGPAARLLEVLTLVSTDAPTLHARLVADALAIDAGQRESADPDPTASPADPLPQGVPNWLKSPL